MIKGINIYTLDLQSYEGVLGRKDVAHGIGEYVRGQANTIGVVSFRSLPQHGIVETYHNMSQEYLPHYVTVFAGRKNNRQLNTMAQAQQMATGIEGKRLRNQHLVG